MREYMPDHRIFFQRYLSPDPAALERQVEDNLKLLAQAQTAQDECSQLELLSKLGAHYTMLEKEDQAAPLLEQALALAKRLHDKRLEVANLISLATAQQYLGNRDIAQELFQVALKKVKVYDQPHYEDFALHHLGRCLVEQGKIAEACACFEQALLLRKSKGDQRLIASSQQALDAVRAM
jgi:tetratricopeptide (TPR) repeat protein